MPVFNPYYYIINTDILQYENAWLEYMNTHERNASVINDTVWSSWERCRAIELDPNSEFPLPKVDENEILNKISIYHNILSIVSPFIDTLFHSFDEPGFMISFSDNNSVVLQCTCDENLKSRVNEINLMPGATLSEESAGTNSVNLSLRYQKPILLIGAEHYCERFHNLVSASVPIMDFTGTILGVLSFWGRYEYANSHILSFLTSSKKAIENEIQVQKINDQLIINNNQLDAILQSVPDGVIYVKDKNIMYCNDEMKKLISKQIISNENIEKVVITSPEIGKLLNEYPNDINNVKVTLFSNNKTYNCLVNKRTVIDSHGNIIGQILIFMQVEEIKRLSKALVQYTAKFTFDDILGESDAINAAKELSKKTAEHNSRIVIEGESGTGKEMFAQAIHNASSRRNAPFVAVDCGAIPKELFESTLFGYEKGAFTGAKPTGNIGAFETSQNGTLFLDEIENMPIEMQAKLLRVLQEDKIVKVGGNKPIPINVRVMVATNTNLQSMVEQGKFREDLLYRLNVAYIRIPPLRERLSDIPMLVKNHLETSSIRNRKILINDDAIKILQHYYWPGNVRQLFNTIERAEIMITGNTITAADLPSDISDATNNTQRNISPTNKKAIDDYINSNKKMTLKELDRAYILECLRQNNNNVSLTSKELQISRPTIYKILNCD